MNYFTTQHNYDRLLFVFQYNEVSGPYTYDCFPVKKKKSACRGKIGVEQENLTGKRDTILAFSYDRTVCGTGADSDYKNKSSTYKGDFYLFN